VNDPSKISPVNAGIVADIGKILNGTTSQASRTIVATGLARSGTSMLASLLRAAGIFMGDDLHDGTGEDGEILDSLAAQQIHQFRAIVARRNAEHAVWGFKLPDLHLLLPKEEFCRLRNPSLIIVTRDPVAVSIRHTLSEHHEVAVPVGAAARAQVEVLGYIEALDCPKLFLSYEKAITLPDEMIDGLLAFCGLPRSGILHQSLRRCIDPNSENYREVAQRRFQGCLDGLIGQTLFGWCRDVHSTSPIDVEVFAGDRCLGVFRADQLRDDLRAGNIGEGYHGFAVDLSQHSLTPDTVLRAKVHGRRYALINSGERLSELILQGASIPPNT